MPGSHRRYVCMRRVSLIVIAGFLVLPSASFAGHGHGHGHGGCPSGNSGVDQYVECVPGAGGNQTSSPPTGGGGGDNGGGFSSSSVPAGTNQALLAHGSAGRNTATLANATAPSQGSASTAR